MQDKAEYINCPEGRIELPIDIWKCKLTGDICPIQACINRGNIEDFHRYCLAPNERQEGIEQAIRLGKYRGFHHMLGKYLCPICKPSRAGRFEQCYHYSWDLYDLQRHVPYTEEELRRKLVESNIDTAALIPICRNCLDKVLAKLGLPSSQELLERRGYGEPMNKMEPISFHMYRSVIEKASGHEPREGTCDWCGGDFAWNADGESVYYDVYGIELGSGEQEHHGFTLCEHCGERLAQLFGITD